MHKILFDLAIDDLIGAANTAMISPSWIESDAPDSSVRASVEMARSRAMVFRVSYMRNNMPSTGRRDAAAPQLTLYRDGGAQ